MVASSLISNLLEGEIAAASAYRRRAKADNTIRAYEIDWRQFEAWCDARGLETLPARPEAVATYLASLAQAGNGGQHHRAHLAAIGWRDRRGEGVPGKR